MTFPLMGLFSHTPYLFIVLLIFRSHNSSDDHPLSFSTYSSSVHTPLFICSHLWLIHGLCALPALNSVPIYSGRQLLSFCRFCQLRILLRFSPNTTLVSSDSDFSLVPSCSHNSPLLSHLRTAPCTSCSTPARTPDQRQCQGGPRWSPEVQSTLVWSSCWGATGSARRSTQRGEQRRVVRARGNKGEVGVTQDQCCVW